MHLEESDLKITIDKPCIRYDEEGPGKQTRFCCRKEADLLIQPRKEELIIVEIKRAEWFNDLFDQNNEKAASEKTCDLFNKVFDTWSGISLIEESYRNGIHTAEVKKVKALFLINQRISYEKWNAIDTKMRRLLNNKFKKTAVEFSFEHQNGKFPSWLKIEKNNL